MQALRKIQKVEGGKIIIELPSDFKCDEVEIIVLPHMKNEQDIPEEQTEDWKKDFLSISSEARPGTFRRRNSI